MAPAYDSGYPVVVRSYNSAAAHVTVTLTGGPGAEPIKQMLDDKKLLCYPTYTPPWSIRTVHTRLAVGVGDD